MTEQIPAKTVYICDGCGTRVPGREIYNLPRNWGRVIAWQTEPIVERDYCPACCAKIMPKIKELKP